jgi:hypothetical protein
MNGRLSVPLYIIAEERTVSCITRNSEVVIDVALFQFRLWKIQDWLMWSITKKLNLSTIQLLRSVSEVTRLCDKFRKY